MARLALVIVFLVILGAGTYMLAKGMGRVMRRVDQGKDYDMAGDGMMPKLAYGLLIALIVYVTLTAAGA